MGRLASNSRLAQGTNGVFVVGTDYDCAWIDYGNGPSSTVEYGRVRARLTREVNAAAVQMTSRIPRQGRRRRPFVHHPVLLPVVEARFLLRVARARVTGVIGPYPISYPLTPTAPSTIPCLNARLPGAG